MLKLNNTITLVIEHLFNEIGVVFTIITILPNDDQTLIADNKVVIANKAGNNTWFLSHIVDLLDLSLNNKTIHKEI